MKKIIFLIIITCSICFSFHSYNKTEDFIYETHHIRYKESNDIKFKKIIFLDSINFLVYDSIKEKIKNNMIKKWRCIIKENSNIMFDLTREYNDKGYEINKLYIDDEIINPLIVSYKYDDNNNLISQKFNYKGNGKNNKVFISDDLEYSYNIIYNQNNKIEAIYISNNHYNGNPKDFDRYFYKYDDNNDLNEVVNFINKTLNYSYFYDKKGNIIKKSAYISRRPYLEHYEYDYKYDENNKLIEYIRYLVVLKKKYNEIEKKIYKYINDNLTEIIYYENKKINETTKLYYENNKLTKLEIYDKKNKLICSQYYSYKYNNKNDIIEIEFIKDYIKNKKQEYLKYEYQYQYQYNE